MSEHYITKLCAQCGIKIHRLASSKNWNHCLGCVAQLRAERAGKRVYGGVRKEEQSKTFPSLRAK